MVPHPLPKFQKMQEKVKLLIHLPFLLVAKTLLDLVAAKKVAKADEKMKKKLKKSRNFDIYDKHLVKHFCNWIEKKIIFSVFDIIWVKNLFLCENVLKFQSYLVKN